MDQGIRSHRLDLLGVAKRSAGMVVGAVLPVRCPACGVLVHGGGLGQPVPLCATCFLKIRRVLPPICETCGWPKELEEDTCLRCRVDTPVHRQRFALIYGDLTTRLLLQFKHGDRPELARRFASWMVQSGPELLEDADLLVPVPVHWRRLWKRQYNQAAELVRYISKEAAVPWEGKVLYRHLPTPSQGHLSPRLRRANVAKAFRVRVPDPVRGKNVVLIDDVVTTGATIDACAKILLKAGAARVDVLAVAAVPL